MKENFKKFLWCLPFAFPVAFATIFMMEPFNGFNSLINISVLLCPFLPFSSEKIADWLETDLDWQEKTLTAKQISKEISVLFQRIE